MFSETRVLTKSTNGASSQIDYATAVLSFIFSWVVLMPIAVIVSGKLLSKRVQLRVKSEQLFSINLLYILRIRAQDDEVILGFTGFIVILLLVGLVAGPQSYTVVKSNFGIDPGQFNSVCLMSSFLTVACTLMLYICAPVIVYDGEPENGPTQEEYDRTIEQVASKKSGEGNSDA